MRTGMETGQAADTLVIYIYSNSDSEYERNLHFFVERGIADGDGSHYIIVVQEVGALLKSNPGLRGFATGVPEDEFCTSHAAPAFGGELYEAVICRRVAMATCSSVWRWLCSGDVCDNA